MAQRAGLVGVFFFKLVHFSPYFLHSEEQCQCGGGVLNEKRLPIAMADKDGYRRFAHVDAMIGDWVGTREGW